jgi:hypothetical protein
LEFARKEGKEVRMHKWTILGAVVLLGMVVAAVANARGYSYGGGCANGQCGMAAAVVQTTETTPVVEVKTAAAEAAPPAPPAPAAAAPAKAEAAKPAPAKAPASTPQKVEKTETSPEPAVSASQTIRTRLFSGRFQRVFRGRR